MKVTYETTECGRCGGSGHYSFNQMDGTRCYGCGGSGKKLTKRGAAAREFANSLLEVRVEEYAEKHNGRVARSEGRRFYSVRESERPVAWRLEKDGSQTPIKGYRLIGGDGEAIVTLGQGLTVRLFPNESDLEQIAAYQDSLTKAGKPRKRA